MPDYRKMYFILFNAITDVIDILQKAEQNTEEIYVSSDSPIIAIFSSEDNDTNKDDD